MITILYAITIVLLVLSITLIVFLYMKNLQIKKLNRTLEDIVRGNINRRIRIQASEKNIIDLTTNINQLLNEWMKNTEKVNRLEHLRKQMITNISHDLRTPLTSILGYAEALLEDGNLSEEEKEKYSQVILKKGEGMLDIINDFFELVRIEGEEGLLQPGKVLLNEVVKEEVLALYPSFIEVNINPTINIPQEALYIWGDVNSMRRILSNLLSNSLRYGHEGKNIGVELKKEANSVQLCVWDQGKGINEEDLPFIFERLYTGEQSRSVNLQGTGLGLTIVKKLVEKHNGKIEVESERDVKTRFTCTFPLYSSRK